jgi:hypothetical protein
MRSMMVVRGLFFAALFFTKRPVIADRTRLPEPALVF